MAKFERRADVAERRAQVLALRNEHRPYSEIAARLGITQSTARNDYKRALDAYTARQRELAGQAVDIELSKLDQLELVVYEVLRRRHVTVSNGRIMGRFTGFAKDPDTGETYRGDDGKPIPLYEDLEDDAPILQAVDRLVKIAQRRAALKGYDAPARIEVSDAVDAEIARLAAELAGMEPPRETAAAGDAAESEVSQAAS